nr:VIT1/CCC1 transporter family protein [Methylosinus sp. LW4]
MDVCGHPFDPIFQERAEQLSGFFDDERFDRFLFNGRQMQCGGLRSRPHPSTRHPLRSPSICCHNRPLLDAGAVSGTRTMPATPHVEKHFTATEMVRDVVIGMSDGLTVPFALAAGLSAAVASTDVIVTAGLAEIAAGAIAMGLGGFLAARTDAQHYASEAAREGREIDLMRDHEIHEIEQLLQGYGLTGDPLKSLVAAISADKERWIDFMMRFELGLEKPDPRRALASALTIGLAYVVGGLTPLVPYMTTDNVDTALLRSVLATGVALLAFGAAKGHFTGVDRARAAIQTLAVGGLAASAAFGLARAFG